MSRPAGDTAVRAIGLIPTDDQLALGAVVRDLIERASPPTVRRALLDSELGYDEGVWRRLVDVGVPGTLVPPGLGGAGLGPVEAAIVAAEVGRGLLAGPVLPSALWAPAVLGAADRTGAGTELLADLAAGARTAAAAMGRTRCATLTAGGETRIHGDLELVLGAEAPHAVVVVPVEHGPEVQLFAVDPADAEVRRRRSLDLTRRFTTLRLDAGRVTLLASAERHRYEAAVDVARVCLAAEDTGVAERCLELSIEHASGRYQFGRAIGSFQAVKHKCADLLLRVEASRSAVANASRVAADGTDDLGRWASLARVYCNESAVAAGGECIQIHGGMGYTWEHDAHLYLRRAKTSSQLLGSPAVHRRRLAGLLGLDGPSSPEAVR